MNLPLDTYVAVGTDRRLGFIRGTATCCLRGQTLHMYIVELDVGFSSPDGGTWVSLLPCHPDNVQEIRPELQHE